MPLKIENTEIHIHGLSRAYTLLHISDAHVAVAGKGDGAQALARVEKQTRQWSAGGISPVTTFEEILDYTEREKPDALLMAGDCVDYISAPNVAYMERRLTALQTPVLYAYGNHEGGSYDVTVPDPRVYYSEYSALMGETPDFQVMDLGDLLVVAVDDSDRRITEEQLNSFRQVFDGGKPIFLLLHIPLCTESLSPDVMRIWGHTFMIGNEHSTPETLEFCRMVKSPESPVQAILAGHVHFAHTGEFAAGRMQYTAAPAFEGFVRRLRVLP